MRSLLLVLAVSLLESDAAPPEPAGADGARDAALVVTIEDYAFLDDVPGAARVGDAWSAWFAHRGVPAGKIRRLADGEAVDFALRSGLEAAAADVGDGGTLWVVFVGRGAPEGLVGADAGREEGAAGHRSVSVSELVETLGSRVPQRAVVVLDADGLGSVPDDARVTVLAAASPGEGAGRRPGPEGPAFARLALDALRGAADTDGDGAVTAAELTAHAGAALRAEGRAQTPVRTGPDRPLAAVEPGPRVAPRTARPDLAAALPARMAVPEPIPAGSLPPRAPGPVAFDLDLGVPIGVHVGYRAGGSVLGVRLAAGVVMYASSPGSMLGAGMIAGFGSFPMDLDGRLRGEVAAGVFVTSEAGPFVEVAVNQEIVGSARGPDLDLRVGAGLGLQSGSSLMLLPELGVAFCW